jgi:hypothetical protein
MEILDRAHLPMYTQQIDLRQRFKFDKYPFKESWLTYVKSNIKHNTSDETYGDSDTTHTHPDCKRRLAAIRRQLEAKSIATRRVENADATFEIARRSELEQVASECHFKNYGKSFFMALTLIDKWPENIYVHSMIGRNLALIYQSLKDHRFGKTVQLPDERLADNYNRVLAFLHNLRTMEVASISYQYMVTKNESFFDDEEFLYSFWFVSKLPVSDLSPQLVKDDYLKRFPQGRYASVLSRTN